MSEACFEAIEQLEQDIAEQEEVQNELVALQLAQQDLLGDGFIMGFLPQQYRATGCENCAENMWVIAALKSSPSVTGRAYETGCTQVNSVFPYNPTVPHSVWKGGAAGQKFIQPQTSPISVAAGGQIGGGLAYQGAYVASTANYNAIYVPVVVITLASQTDLVLNHTMDYNTINGDAFITSCPTEGLGQTVDLVDRNNHDVSSSPAVIVGPYRIRTYLWAGQIARAFGGNYGIWKGLSGGAKKTFSVTKGSVTKSVSWSVTRG